jgi:hypothetical protein
VGNAERKELRTRLLGGELNAVAQEAAADRRVVRGLVKLLYDELLGVRHLAAAALGIVAELEPGRVAQIPSRMLWALNDESGMNCHGAAAAVAEIAVRRPAIAGGFVSPLVHYLDDEHHLAEVLWAIALLAESYPEAISDLRPHIEPLVSSSDSSIRAMSARALIRLGWLGREKREHLAQDRTEVELFEDGKLLRLSIGEIVRRELARTR